MAERADAQFTWTDYNGTGDYRTVVIDGPSFQFNVQDIVDTLRAEEAKVDNLIYKSLFWDTEGKAELSEDLVAITATLRHCKIGFAGRSGPDWELCLIKGGNVVLKNEAFVKQTSIVHHTPFVDVVTTESSTGTSIQQEALDYASYQNAVWVNTNLTDEEAGIGNRQFPTNTIAKGVVIGNAKGFSTLQLISPVTLTDGDNVSNFNLIGRSHIQTVVTIETLANCENVCIKECNVTGILDGGTMIRECMVGDITYMNGHIHNSALYGIIILGGNEDALISDCGIVDVNSLPIVDMGGDGQNLVVTDWHGRSLTLRNLTGSNVAEIAMSSGIINIDSTVSAGAVMLSGIGGYVDNSTGTSVVNHDDLVEGTLIHAIDSKTDTLVTNLSSVMADITFLKDIEGGMWKIISNQMVFYKADNITEVARFDLYNASGNPSMDNVFERQRV